MTLQRTTPRTIAGISALLLTVGLLSACTPEPEPTPTPTAAFASEEEAFAAAEEVYRAYNDAGNARLRGDRSPNPQDFLIGEALEGDIDAGNLLNNQGLHAEGSVGLSSFSGTSVNLTATDATIVAIVCLDVSETRVVDSTGEDVTPSSRPGVVAQSVTFVGTVSDLSISQEKSEDETAC